MTRLGLLCFFTLALAPFSAYGQVQARSDALVLEAPSDRRPKSSGLLQAPIFPNNKDALAQFKLVNNWRERSADDYFTFGQAFPAGVLTPGEKIAAQYADQTLPAQIDVKALHDDGSVRHAVVTIVTPPVKEGEQYDGALVKALDNESTPQLSGPFDAQSILKEKFYAPVAVTFYYADGSTQSVEAHPRSDIIDKAAQQDDDFWLNGSLVKEFRFETPLSLHLQLRYDIRIYRDGDIRVSVGFTNEKSFAPGRRDSVYDVKISSAFVAQKVPHHRAANWRRVFWAGQQPRLHLMHDLETLIASNAIIPLDTSLGVDASLVAERDGVLRNLPPLSPALIHRYMPATGGRPDIGVYPQWTSHYLASRTETAKRVMLTNAEAAGGVPWHFADDLTGAPVSIERRPKFWADERGLETQYAPDRPNADIFASSDGGWSPDHSHKPALTAVPYLVTGDRYFADELAMQAAWAIFGRWPALREGGVKAIDVEQVRASAWSLRDLSDAAFLLPDEHPSKSYLSRALAENLNAAKKKYVDDGAMRAAGELEGFFEEFIEREPERISPWQNDYMALSLWLSARRGDKNATALLNWTSNFHARRFVDPSFDYRFGAAYQLPIKDAQTQHPLPIWGGLLKKILVHEAIPDRMAGYPELANGYIGSAYAALIAITSQTQSPTAFEALAVLMAKTKPYVMWTQRAEGGVFRNNNFLFTLTAPNGAVYTRRDISWKKAPNTSGGVVIGAVGSERLEGSPGDDVIFGFDGDDVIYGDSGNDYINGGAGNNVLSGGAGRDIFAFSNPNSGVNRIIDFTPDEDVIHISSNIISFEGLNVTKVTQIQEGAKISIEGDRFFILLEGVRATSLSHKNIIKID